MTNLGTLDLPVTVRLTDGMTCWAARYQTNVVRQNPDHSRGAGELSTAAAGTTRNVRTYHWLTHVRTASRLTPWH